MCPSLQRGGSVARSYHRHTTTTPLSPGADLYTPASARYNTGMNATVAQLERSIRELPLEERVALHERLVATILDAEEAKGLEPGFRRDLEGRVKEVRAGKAEGVDALRALTRM